MSMQVPVELLSEVVVRPERLRRRVRPSGPPRVTHVMPTFSGETLTFGLGRTSCALLKDNPHLCVLWPATHTETMSLIVDADVLGVAADGTVTVRDAAAVRHRPAHDAG